MQRTQDIADFIEWHRLRVLRTTGKLPSASTLKQKASRLRVCCEITGSPDLEVLSTHIQDREKLENLLDGLAARMTSGAAAVAYYALGSFAGYAKAKGWISVSALKPTDRPPHNPQKPIQVYSPEELQALLSASRLRGVRWWAFLHTMAGTGRRAGEILGLEWAWLNLTADVPHFNLPTTKNGRQQYVPLSKFLREQVFTEENIAEMRAENRLGQVNREFGKDPNLYPFCWSYSSVAKQFEAYCRKLGIESRGFHCFRHTKATELLGKGVPIQAVSALLGHASVATTDAIYNHATALSFAHYVE